MMETEPTANQDWKLLFEAALLEQDPNLFALRLQMARDAIVDEMEGSFDNASSTDRRLLLAALNTISGLYESSDMQRPSVDRVFMHSA